MDEVESLTTESLLKRAELSDRTPTALALPLEELEQMADFAVLPRIGRFDQTAPQVYAKNARRALLDCGMVLPDIDVVTLWCNQSMWLCVWGTRTLHDLLQQVPASGAKKREVSFVKIDGEGANHCVRCPHKRYHGVLLINKLFSTTWRDLKSSFTSCLRLPNRSSTR